MCYAVNNMVADDKTEILLSDKTEILSAANSHVEGLSQMDKLEDFFAIKSKVGDGGMGVVYLAKDIRLNRYVAIKRLKPQFLVDAQIRKRFLHEAKAVASLNHSNIVHIYFIGEDNDGPYFVMEYIEGAVANAENPNQPNPPQTLEQYIATNGVMEIDEGIDFLAKIGGAVAAAHASGVIHRDLKPTNILIGISNFPKIVDFGLARITHVDVAASSLTVKGDKFISLGYGAPEQEQDASTTDERADVYGLGGIAYYVLTGKNPRFFREDDLPENIRPIITKALATDREQRWSTAEAFIAALIQCKSGVTIDRPTVKTTWRCKWCDTINPLTTRYCGSCGWDGGTTCPECGAPNHFGVMFCSTCGANSKEYERAQAALDEARSALASAQFDRVIVNGSKPLNFEPVGPNGRKVIDEINQIFLKAKKSQDRREELTEIISMEINAENYERAERFINEYRMLVNSPEAFETELSEFPKLIQRRDLARVAKAFSINDWSHGSSILEKIGLGVGSANELELRRLQNLYKKHMRRKHMSRYQIAFLIVFIYFLMLPFAAVYLPNGFVRRVWYPANAVVNTIGLGGATEAIAKTLGGGNVAEMFHVSNKTTTSPTNVDTKFTLIQREFDISQSSFKKSYDENLKTWQQEYISALEKLSDTFLLETNINAWCLVDEELNRFKQNPEAEISISNFDPQNNPLSLTEDVYHRINSLKNEYIIKRDTMLGSVYYDYMGVTSLKIEELDVLIKDLMLKCSSVKNDGNEAYAQELMDEVLQYRNIIVYVKQTNFYLAADAFLASFQKKYPDVYLADFNEPLVKEKRATFEQRMADFSTQRQTKKQKLFEDYVKALDELLEKSRAAGDYDGIKAITEEQKRFEQKKTIIANSSTPALSDLTEKFIAREQSESIKIDQDLIAYVDSYITELNQLVKDYTRANNMNVAGALKAESTRVQMDPDIVVIRERIK